MSGAVAAGAASRRSLTEAADRVLLTDLAGRALSGAELAQRIAALAGALARRQLTGRRIGLWYRNSTAAFEAFLATEWIGATRVPVDPEAPATEARAVFDAAGVDLVLADDEHGALLGGDTLIHDDHSGPAGSPWEEQLEVEASFPLLVYPRSVSSGELFGVTTSYGNWDAIMEINIRLYAEGWYGPALTGHECALTMQQLMHGTGMVASFPFLLMGLPQVVMARFDAAAAVEAIRRHGVTTTFGVPGMLTRLADVVGEDSPELPLRRTLYGGAPLPADELRRVRRVLGPSLVQLYGRFEAGWPLAVLGPSEHTAILEGDDELAASCGRLIPQIEARFGEAPGTPVGHGELQTRNPMVAPEYADPEGWCALGDVAYLDSRDYLHLAGRLDGMINTGSYHVYPQQVAEAIESIAGVTAAKVTGEDDPVWGQAVVASVVADDPGHWDELVARLKTELPARLARYKIPKTFRRVERLP
jgi:acyl-CoA synthetase (AMP-forming)/AMP-acid ligase II